MRTYYIVYPEHRSIGADRILTWYADAYANKELDEPATSPEHITSDEAARALDFIGHITLGHEV